MTPDPDDPIPLVPSAPAPRQTEIALWNGSSAWSARDFAFVSRAIEIQVMRDFLPAWRDAILALGCAWMPPVSYSSLDGLPAGSYAPLSVLDDIQEAGALGFHDWELESWGRSKPDSVTLSHEVLELLADPKCDGWVPGPGGNLIAREVCDPCEDQSYGIDVTVGDETRTVKVSNFVTPRYFLMAFGDMTKGYDFLGLMDAPFKNEGYLIVKSPDGTVSNVFAASDRAYMARVQEKGWWSRTGRRKGLTP